MNITKDVKRVLVYGDSFTYGKASGENRRLAVDERFTGVLQEQLGHGYDVIEEGLRARNLVGENPFFTDRDGLKTFGPIIGSHLPVDLVVIALGTNDCNSREGFDATGIAGSLRQYCRVLQGWSDFLNVAAPKLLALLPPDIVTKYFDESMNTVFGNAAADKVVRLRDDLRSVCGSLGVPVLDASAVCQPALGDGIHLDVENNKKLADALAQEVRNVIG